MERPYKVWCYPYAIYLVLAFMTCLVINTIYQDPVTAALGLIVPLVGLGIYEVFFRRQHEAVEKLRRSEGKTDLDA